MPRVGSHFLGNCHGEISASRVTITVDAVARGHGLASRVNEEVGDLVGSEGGNCQGTGRSPRGWKGTVILATETGTGGCGREGGRVSSLRRIKPERLSLR